MENYPALQQFLIPSVRPTGKILGNGAYGEVVEAKIPGAVCAVKKIHGYFEREDSGYIDREMVGKNRRKFVKECELMSCLRHPHIVQFLGVCMIPGSDTPALVTELLLTDLHTMLLPTPRSTRKPHIPLGLKFSILYDVAQGLLFLHSQSPPIIHRDITATNVLLNSAMVAKIADLGVARFMPEIKIPLTKGPGNAVYMPPEAQGDTYDKSIDVFSFAVLSLFTFTQTFPDPLPVKYLKEGVSLLRTEVQRRSHFLEQARNEMKDQSPLIDAIEQCLNDDPKQRLDIQRILALLEVVKCSNMENHVKMNKLELMQAIEREQKEHIEQMQEMMQQRDREFQLAIDEKVKAFEVIIRENEVKCGEVSNQEGQEAISQLEKEKKVVQEKERQILGELRQVLEKDEAVIEGNSIETMKADRKSQKQEAGVEMTTSERTKVVMIIGSIITPPQPPSTGYFSVFLKKKQPVPDVGVPQFPPDLSDGDCQVLKKLNLPSYQWDNLNALLAIYNKTEYYDVFSIQVSKPGMELSRSYILEQIESLLNDSKNRTKGVVLHYYGNGRRNTGDWCFRDGFITFRDIADLYMKYSCGRMLTIVPDCHSSGRWVSECAKFLDEQGVKPCGHSAKEKGILLKVYAGSLTAQDTAELCYITRAMGLDDDGYVYHYTGTELSAQQNTFGVDFTKMRCKKEEEEECSIALDSTWSTAGEVISWRKFLVRLKDRGRPSWHYILLDDDAEKIKHYIHKTQEQNAGQGTIILSKYGTVLRSGQGIDPLDEDENWLDNYGYQ